jgi:dipeptidyl aminopeptidase/acylaminoacyl peptidase
MSADLISGISNFEGPIFPWSNVANLEKWNPARPDLVNNWRDAPPTLVIHSEKDYRCVVTEGQAIFKTLKALGVPSRYLYFSDESHFVVKPENALVWHHVIFEWIERWVGKGPTIEE